MTVVSVCCPLFNKASYIQATVESVRAQSHQELEMLIVDNGSTDGGPAIVSAQEIADARIKLLSTKQRGPGQARNHAVEHARGDWILFLDADDLIEPDHLAQLVTVAGRHPEASIVAGGWKEFDDCHPGEFTTKRPASDHEPERLVDRAFATAPWAVHAALLRRELAVEHPWPAHMDGLLAEDNAFWFPICLHGDVAFSNSSGAWYRTRTPNCRTQSDDIRKWYIGVSAAVEENISALRMLGRTPNSEQAALLMRLFSGLYRQSIQSGDGEFAAMSKDKASYWLRHCEPFSTAILARKILGIHRFEKARRLFA